MKSLLPQPHMRKMQPRIPTISVQKLRLSGSVRKRGLSTLVATLGLAAMPIGAQQAVNIADIRCVVVGMKMAGATNSPDQSRGFLLTLYYIGRLDGRRPQLDIEHLLIEETHKMANADYVSEEKRCGEGLAAKGQQITEIGKHLIETGKKTPGRSGQ
jgi:hypothetical protein